MNKYVIKRMINLILICLLTLETFLMFFHNGFVKADSFRYEYNSNNLDYPGYKERIDAIKANHPNWKFIIMETGLDWNEVISNEYTGHFGVPSNLIQGKSGGWVCSICGSKVYDTGNWVCASESAIRYYMDTRNWLVDSPYLFQFLQIDYMDTLDQDIYAALNGTFLYSMDTASIINRVCKEKNASPYFIIARILQEQGTAGGMTYRMQDTDGKIYYNLFNIGATGNTESEVYYNALDKAKKENWTSLQSCLEGGISFLISSYVSYKQNTMYLNKFDVEPYLGLYSHQYMQNIEAPKNEAISMYNKMKNANLLSKNLTFVIPVYENMPETASPSPDTAGEVFPKNIRVKEGHFGIMVRAGRSTDSSILGRISGSSEIILSVERFSDGWHKIVLEDGTVGYLKFNTDYLEEVADVVNCYEQKILNSNYTLRVGPGFEHTEITNLKAGDIVYRIDNTGRYTFGGTVWDRVVMQDGRQGFLPRNVLEDKKEDEKGKNTTTTGNTIDSENESQNKIDDENVIKSENNIDGENVVQNDDENKVQNENSVDDENTVQNENGIDNENIVQSENSVDGENIVQNDNNIDNENATQNGNDTNSENENNNNGNTSQNENTGPNENNNIEQNVIENKDTNNEIIEDDTTQSERKYLVIAPDKQAKDLGGVVTKNGVETEEAGTGYIINIDGKEYIIVKRGDANGDGYVKANDYLIIKDYIIGTNTNLADEYLQAADVTNDKFVKANDYLKIKDHIMYEVEI